MTLEELLDHFVFHLEEVNIFNEEEFIEDIFKGNEIPQEWLKKEIKEWSYDNSFDLLIVKI